MKHKSSAILLISINNRQVPHTNDESVINHQWRCKHGSNLVASNLEELDDHGRCEDPFSMTSNGAIHSVQNAQPIFEVALLFLSARFGLWTRIDPKRKP